MNPQPDEELKHLIALKSYYEYRLRDVTTQIECLKNK